MWWRRRAAFWLVLPFFCLGKVCRGRNLKAGHKGGNCYGMCKVPNKPNLGGQTKCPALGVARPHDALLMPCHALVAKWVGGLHIWVLSLPRVGRLGVANVGLLQAWSAKVPLAKMAHCRPKTANRWLEVPDWSIVFQKQPQKTRFGKPRPPWQVLLRNVQISANLAQNLSPD